MNRKIVIAGGTGFIGQYLETHFQNEGYEVIIISRRKQHIRWEDDTKIINALEDAGMLINLAGKSVDCRYNEKNKNEILHSRIETTRILGKCVMQCKTPPLLWINASTATIYRHAEDRPMTEKDGETGQGFSVDVATSWEKTFFSFRPAHTRQVALRMAIVLGKDGGVMKPFMRLVQFGLGGKQGNGKQMFSWIHIEDVYHIIQFLYRHKELKGVYNCAAPGPVSNRCFMKTLRNVMHIKTGLPSPAWLLALGALIIKTETELILKSRWVIPEKLVDAGYTFKHPDLKDAIEQIIHWK